MSVACWFHAIRRGGPFFSKGGEPSFEPAALYLCVALVLIALGRGRFSLDRVLFGRE